MSRKTAVAALALLLALAISGCSNDRDALTIYSGRTQNLIGPLLEKFNKDTGIAIDVKYGDSAELALLLDEEGDRTPADVFLSQSPGATGFLAGKGRLGQLEGDVLDKVDQRFRNADGRWVGISGRQRVLVYNSEEVTEAELPDSVLDLTDDRFAGKVAVAPSNGSFQDFVTAMRQLEGEAATEAWLKDMVANKPRTYANNNAIVEAAGPGAPGRCLGPGRRPVRHPPGLPGPPGGDRGRDRGRVDLGGHPRPAGPDTAPRGLGGRRLGRARDRPGLAGGPDRPARPPGGPAAAAPPAGHAVVHRRVRAA